MKIEDICWLAGLLEGEGSFVKGPPSSPSSPQISIEMTDEDVIARAASLCGVRYHKSKRRKEAWKDSYHFRLRGAPAVTLMRRLEPLMGERRKKQIAIAISCHNPQRIRSRDWDDAALIKARATMSFRQIGKLLGVPHESVRRRLLSIAS